MSRSVPPLLFQVVFFSPLRSNLLCSRSGTRSKTLSMVCSAFCCTVLSFSVTLSVAFSMADWRFTTPEPEEFVERTDMTATSFGRVS